VWQRTKAYCKACQGKCDKSCDLCGFAICQHHGNECAKCGMKTCGVHDCGPRACDDCKKSYCEICVEFYCCPCEDCMADYCTEGGSDCYTKRIRQCSKCKDAMGCANCMTAGLDEALVCEECYSVFESEEEEEADEDPESDEEEDDKEEDENGDGNEEVDGQK
jgi:hypothetical protein